MEFKAVKTTLVKLQMPFLTNQKDTPDLSHLTNKKAQALGRGNFDDAYFAVGYFVSASSSVSVPLKIFTSTNPEIPVTEPFSVNCQNCQSGFKFSTKKL